MMKTESSDAAWGRRAFILGNFSVQRVIERKPSDWRLVQYLLYRALGTIGIIGKSTALFKHTKQRLPHATLASMEKARNPIWIDRAQRFEDAWAKKKKVRTSHLIGVCVNTFCLKGLEVPSSLPIFTAVLGIRLFPNQVKARISLETLKLSKIK